jgi:hypothetical protein
LSALSICLTGVLAAAAFVGSNPIGQVLMRMVADRGWNRLPIRRGGQRSWRWEGGRQIRRLHLEKLLRPGQAVELVQAKIPEADPSRLGAGQRIPNRAREQDLAAVTREADPGGDVDGKAHVSGVGQRWTPRMQADPHADG